MCMYNVMYVGVYESSHMDMELEADSLVCVCVCVCCVSRMVQDVLWSAWSTHTHTLHVRNAALSAIYMYHLHVHHNNYYSDTNKGV